MIASVVRHADGTELFLDVGPSEELPFIVLEHGIDPPKDRPQEFGPTISHGEPEGTSLELFSPLSA
ncbi:hypothetical protein [Aureimonas pseudogalii]|uniref:Uncharacterized protein n=1 Tax=Aureimonas pseudogalii TaxID=1744844 RepID=A0A7W6MLK1_9HYPH|nr:hypothetical protein [Aureimonas pseudogalii]MBB3999867.1 hypothetical protein [Aureimonas pseudogalii]